MSQKKTTLVIGASENPERYSNKAIQLLRHYNHPVLALGLRKGTVADVAFETDLNAFNGTDIDTVTLYINAKLQAPFYDKIIALKPKRVLFNPGTENLEFETLLEQNGIDCEEACTLVLLNTGQF